MNTAPRSVYRLLRDSSMKVSLFVHTALSLQLSALFRVPLNIFVVVSLMTGVSSARNAVLSASSLMLASSALMTAFVVVPKVDDATSPEMNYRPK